MRRLILPLLLVTTPPAIQAVEEPSYEIVRQIGADIERRRYPAYVVAEVVLNATAAEAGSLAFPILSGYLFAKNKGERKLEMTAPVTQVGVARAMRVQFVLPKDVTLATAPEPASLVTEGQPVLARYNGPMTPWFMRRNEVWLEVR